MLWDHATSNGGAPNKLDMLNHYFQADMGTAIVKTAMKLQGKEVLLVATVCGAILAYVPAASKEEVSFFQHLEM